MIQNIAEKIADADMVLIGIGEENRPIADWKR